MSDNALIRAHLHLNAVLQNLEELVRLDPDMAALVKPWDVTIQFAVRNGPAAYVSFQGGVCTHGAGTHPNPSVKLFFTSPKHLNGMFDGKATPIPLKGFTRLGFLRREFSKLTDRLVYYLKPQNGKTPDDRYVKISTVLMLNTAVYAIKELAALDPVSKKVAAHIPAGALQVEVRPDGPYIHAVFAKDGVTVHKGKAEKPMATMTFRDLPVANALLTNRLDGFLAVANEDVLLHGLIPMIDNVNLILDRVPIFLS